MTSTETSQTSPGFSDETPNGASSHAPHRPWQFILALARCLVCAYGASMKAVRKITRWRDIAIVLYFRTYGRRCVKCSEPVELRAAALYAMEEGELLLFHEGCKP